MTTVTTPLLQMIGSRGNSELLSHHKILLFDRQTPALIGQRFRLVDLLIVPADPARGRYQALLSELVSPESVPYANGNVRVFSLVPLRVDEEELLSLIPGLPRCTGQSQSPGLGARPADRKHCETTTKSQYRRTLPAPEGLIRAARSGHFLTGQSHQGPTRWIGPQCICEASNARHDGALLLMNTDDGLIEKNGPSSLLRSRQCSMDLVMLNGLAVKVNVISKNAGTGPGTDELFGRAPAQRVQPVSDNGQADEEELIAVAGCRRCAALTQGPLMSPLFHTGKNNNNMKDKSAPRRVHTSLWNCPEQHTMSTLLLIRHCDRAAGLQWPLACGTLSTEPKRTITSSSTLPRVIHLRDPGPRSARLCCGLGPPDTGPQAHARLSLHVRLQFLELTIDLVQVECRERLELGGDGAFV
ncbi:hypothetical protein WMY93_031246 [Mugilogobius chulae]|uniref:Uncharacterized protein n=1 Tax=Mugilogobius chulae TaxID=88201 RepID=A0AAW0MGB9_9GOBI